jgi:hypothetical protein
MSNMFPVLLFAYRTIGSLTISSLELYLVTLPVTAKLPVILTSPEIVPPAEANLVFA